MSVLLSQVMEELGQYDSSVADLYLFGMGDPYSVFEVGPPTPTRLTSESLSFQHSADRSCFYFITVGRVCTLIISDTIYESVHRDKV